MNFEQLTSTLVIVPNNDFKVSRPSFVTKQKLALKFTLHLQFISSPFFCVIHIYQLFLSQKYFNHQPKNLIPSPRLQTVSWMWPGSNRTEVTLSINLLHCGGNTTVKNVYCTILPLTHCVCNTLQEHLSFLAVGQLHLFTNAWDFTTKLKSENIISHIFRPANISNNQRQ